MHSGHQGPSAVLADLQGKNVHLPLMNHGDCDVRAGKDGGKTVE
jgi:hypothetical protein